MSGADWKIKVGQASCLSVVECGGGDRQDACPTLLHEQASPRALGVVRAWVFTLWLGDLLREPIHELAELPLECFQPIGVLRLLPATVWPAVFTPECLWTLKIGLAVLLLPLILGVGPYRTLAVTACLLLTFWQGLHRGMLSVVHRELALLYVTYTIALFPAADAFSLRRGKKEFASPAMYRAPLVAATLMFCLTYMAVGVRRLTEGGVEIFLDGTILRYVVLRSAEPGFWSEGAGWLVLEHPWLGWLVQTAFPVVTAFEVCAPLCLFSRRFRWAWLVVMLAFHWGSRSMMQIWFLHNVLLMPVLLIEIDPLLRRLIPVQSRSDGGTSSASPFPDGGGLAGARPSKGDD